jgi:hypothetical protein
VNDRFRQAREKLLAGKPEVDVTKLPAGPPIWPPSMHFRGLGGNAAAHPVPRAVSSTQRIQQGNDGSKEQIVEAIRERIEISIRAMEATDCARPRRSIEAAERLLRVVADRGVLGACRGCTKRLWQAVEVLLHPDAEWPDNWGKRPDWADDSVEKIHDNAP